MDNRVKEKSKLIMVVDVTIEEGLLLSLLLIFGELGFLGEKDRVGER